MVAKLRVDFRVHEKLGIEGFDISAVLAVWVLPTGTFRERVKRVRLRVRLGAPRHQDDSEEVYAWYRTPRTPHFRAQQVVCRYGYTQSKVRGEK